MFCGGKGAEGGERRSFKRKANEVRSLSSLRFISSLNSSNSSDFVFAISLLISSRSESIAPSTIDLISSSLTEFITL